MKNGPDGPFFISAPGSGVQGRARRGEENPRPRTSTPVPSPLYSGLRKIHNAMKFGFQKLEVYKLARAINKKIFFFLKENKSINRDLRSQLTRAALSVPLNISEGSGRFSKRDKRHYYITARASALECVAAFDALLDQEEISAAFYESITDEYASLTRMLFKLIESMNE